MLYFLSLYLATQILSFCLLPLTTKLFSCLADKGYAFSKSASLVITGFTVWFLISLNLFKFSQTTILIVLLILSLFSFAILIRSKLHWPTRHQLFYILLVEALFLIIFSFTAYLKYRTSPIRGTEKPMDLALISGISRSEYFPPNDAWYSGKPINYYYYGHYLIAYAAKLTDIPISDIYTLALPLTFSLTGLNIFGLVFNAVKKKSYAIVFGILALTLVLFGANFDTPVQTIKSLINGIKPVISWWDPSRVIGRGLVPGSYITITEFPYFSLLLGDVHAHVLALVLGSLFLGVCYAFFKRPAIPTIIFGSLVLASLAMTNPWEIPGYLLLFGLITLLAPRGWPNGLPRGVLSFLLLFVFSFPFLNNFEMIRAVNDPKPLIALISDVSLIGRRTLLSEFFTIWGTHLAVIGVALVITIKKLSPRRFLFLKLPRPTLPSEIVFPLIVSFVGISLILFCELFFINDFFTQPGERMNTVFKLYFQAWTILGAGAFILLGNVWADISKSMRPIIVAVISLFIFGNFAYFVSLTPVRLREFNERSWGVNGLKYLESGSSAEQGDLASINWFNANVKKQFNLVESVIDPAGGNSYNRTGRISAATGLPAVLGWYAVNHEAGWRNMNSDVYQRAADVNELYRTQGVERAKFLLQKYQIKYVYIGQLERDSYPESGLNKFNKMGKLVFSHPYSQIYEITPL